MQNIPQGSCFLPSRPLSLPLFTVPSKAIYLISIASYSLPKVSARAQFALVVHLVAIGSEVGGLNLPKHGLFFKLKALPGKSAFGA